MLYTRCSTGGIIAFCQSKGNFCEFFQNILYGVIFLRKRQELALVSPAEETHWMEALNQLDGITYMTSANKVVIPETFLQAPLFHAGFPNSVNLGGMGVHLAKAMLSGVLGRGLLFDTDGRLRPHNGSLFGGGEHIFFLIVDLPKNGVNKR